MQEAMQRGAMELKIAELEAFSTEWLQAGDHIVLHWDLWEARAQTFFEHYSNNGELLHGVMNVVCAVCHGDCELVKQELRNATPSVLAACRILFSHIPQFYTVLDAELNYRCGLLESDWSMKLKGDELTVQTVHRKAARGTEH